MDGASIEAAATTLPATCGGTTDVSGWIDNPEQPFTAEYVYAYYVDGCGAIGLTIADRQTNPTTTLELVLTPVPETNSLVGESTPAVTLTAPQIPSITLGSMVDVTKANVWGDGPDAAASVVAGTLNLQVTGFSIAGSFSTPICALRIGCL